MDLPAIPAPMIPTITSNIIIALKPSWSPMLMLWLQAKIIYKMETIPSLN
jgi:hypothetical protein